MTKLPEIMVPIQIFVYNHLIIVTQWNQQKISKKNTETDSQRLFIQFLVRLFLSMTSFQSVFWSSLYFLLILLFAATFAFYLCIFLFSFAFFSPYSAHFKRKKGDATTGGWYTPHLIQQEIQLGKAKSSFRHQDDQQC